MRLALFQAALKFSKLDILGEQLQSKQLFLLLNKLFDLILQITVHGSVAIAQKFPCGKPPAAPAVTSSAPEVLLKHANGTSNGNQRVGRRLRYRFSFLGSGIILAVYISLPASERIRGGAYKHDEASSCPSRDAVVQGQAMDYEARKSSMLVCPAICEYEDHDNCAELPRCLPSVWSEPGGAFLF